MATGVSVPAGHSYILTSDVQGEKGVGKIMTAMWVDMIKSPKTVTVSRGELLGRCEDLPPTEYSFDRSRHHNYYCKSDHSITLYGGEGDRHVSPVRSTEGLLQAIPNLADRYAVFCEPNKLEWGARLEKGNEVRVNISPSSAPMWVKGRVMFVGYVEPLPGKNFGIEIMVSNS